MALLFAVLTLLGVYGLAYPAGVKYSPADGNALLFLAACFFVGYWPPLRRRLVENRDAATFALLAAAFILYQLADRAGPESGWSLKFAAMPDDEFVLSYALRLVVLGAIVSSPAWWKNGGPERYIGAALLLVGVLGGGMFWYLCHFYKIGAESFTPEPMVTLYLQIVGYGCLALCCRAATATETMRIWLLRVLPFALLLLWARHHFIAVPAEEDE